MRKKYIFGKKLYISILTSIVVLLTTVATTFAWVGVFANSTFDQFDFNIKSSRLEEYGIEISLSGKENSFSDTISGEEIKKEILKNWGYSVEDIEKNGVNSLFNLLVMDQCTTLPTINSSGNLEHLNTFYDMEGNITNKLYKFDIYISATHFYEGTTSDYTLEVFLGNQLFSGSSKKRTLVYPFKYSSNFINPLESESLPQEIIPIVQDTTITSAKVNSKSAARIAFEKYEVVDKYHPEQCETSLPKSTIIYSGDSYNYPTYNNVEDIYEFGGILEDDINLGIGNYNSSEWKYSKTGIKSVSLVDSNADFYGGSIYQIRGVNGTNPDTILSPTTNRLIDPTNDDEQIGIHQMMKIGVSFWFEGWDADCWNATAGSPVTINISLSIKPEEN